MTFLLRSILRLGAAGVGQDGEIPLLAVLLPRSIPKVKSENEASRFKHPTSPSSGLVCMWKKTAITTKRNFYLARRARGVRESPLGGSYADMIKSNYLPDVTALAPSSEK